MGGSGAEQRLDLRSSHQLLQEALHDLLVMLCRNRRLEQSHAFLVNVLFCQIGSSGLSFKSQRNSRLQVVVEFLQHQLLRADPVERRRNEPCSSGSG
jgi:hypothetical protein